MLIVHVFVKVKPDCIDAFKEATIANASQSVKEPGIARFDVMQQMDDPTRFVLIEAYRSAEATTAHKATPHYAAWRDRMESLMAEPRYSVKYWGVPGRVNPRLWDTRLLLWRYDESPRRALVTWHPAPDTFFSMPFEFATATRIIFGEGAVRQVVPAAIQWGRRVLVVTGHASERANRLRADLQAAGANPCTFAVAGEPTIDLVARGLQQAREEQCDVVIALGGGSAIDAGKAIAALLTNPGEVLDYLEVVGKGKALQNPAAPFIAVPTTAGTGSEVTRNAVLGVPERQVKVSLRSPLLLPRLAVVDPDLTLDLPPAVTARTGLDALTQLIEAYVSIRANPMTDGFCLQGIPLAARSLRRVFHHGHDLAARRAMSLAALLSGTALANAGLGVIHGFAAPIGGRFPAPHGAICAAILSYGMEINLRALRARAPESAALDRYRQVACLLTGQNDATAEGGIAWTREICEELEIPPLRAYGVGDNDILFLVAEAARASSTQGNPLPLSPDEMREILTRSM